MAVDTRSRRACVLGVANPIILTLPEPAGAISQAERQHVAFCYSGILSEVVAGFTVSAGEMNETLRDYLNNQYGITNLDLNPLLDRFLDADAIADKTVSFRDLKVDTDIENR